MNEPAESPIAWLSTAEAAVLLGVTAPAVYQLMDQGDLVGYRFGRVIRVSAQEVERYRGNGGGEGVPAEV